MNLTPNTKFTVTLAGIGSLIVTLVTVAVIITQAANRLEARLAVFDIQLVELKQRFELTERDGYTLARAAEVALRNAILNPGMKFADPRDPNRVIVVESGRVSPP